MSNNIYFTDDVVEIINISSSQVYDIRSQTCDFQKQPAADIVGQKYKLHVTISSTSYISTVPLYRMQDWNHGGHMASYFSPSQFILYKRPFKNWIKLIAVKFKNLFA